MGNVLAITFWLEKKTWVLMGRVVEMILDERLGFYEIFPIFADTLEALQGFHRKTYENVSDDFIGKHWCNFTHRNKAFHINENTCTPITTSTGSKPIFFRPVLIFNK